ncbi:general substrate transporter [Rhexocercosporidium sp. MPI-PUGE-AT-0058]|nr:general substrate transporter [Rhexocercosporidium sp. MPI-PUGE-AT-0058]
MWTRTKRGRESNAPTAEHVEMKRTRGSGDMRAPPPYDIATANRLRVGGEAVSPQADLVDIEDTPLSCSSWFVPGVSGIGGALFGYDTGTIGHVLPHLNGSLDGGITTGEKAAVVAMSSVGAFFGGLCVLLSDKFGRKTVMYLSAALYIIGAVLQATARSVPQIIIARMITGFSIGSASAVAPMYIGEVAPAKSRGKMTGMFNLAITGTQLVGYAVGVGLGDKHNGWRIMTGIGGGIAVLWILLLPFCPESPRHLVAVNRRKAEVAVQKLRPNASPEQVGQHVEHLHMHMEAAKLARGGRGNLSQFKLLFNKENRWKTFAACGLMALSQLSGFNSLMYFAPTLLVALGFSPLVAVAIPATNLLVTTIYMTLVDRMGRRHILLTTSPLMSFSLIISVIAWALNDTLLTSRADDIADLITAGEIQRPPLDSTSFIILGTMVGLVVGYAGAIGNLAWTSSEFFPTELRPHGTMLMNMCNWGPNVLVSGTFLPLFENAGAPATSAIYAAFSATGTIFAYFFYPEVMGLPLEDIKEVFAADESPVKTANRKQRELREIRRSRDRMARGDCV